MGYYAAIRKNVPAPYDTCGSHERGNSSNKVLCSVHLLRLCKKERTIVTMCAYPWNISGRMQKKIVTVLHVRRRMKCLRTGWEGDFLSQCSLSYLSIVVPPVCIIYEKQLQKTAINKRPLPLKELGGKADMQTISMHYAHCCH